MPRPTRATPEELAPAPFPSERSEDPAVEVARLFAIALKAQTDATSVRAVAEAAGLNHATLLAIIKGRTWPDMLTIAKLESSLGVDLWPGRAS